MGAHAHEPGSPRAQGASACRSTGALSPARLRAGGASPGRAKPIFTRSYCPGLPAPGVRRVPPVAATVQRSACHQWARIRAPRNRVHPTRGTCLSPVRPTLAADSLLAFMMFRSRQRPGARDAHIVGDSTPRICSALTSLGSLHTGAAAPATSADSTPGRHKPMTVSWPRRHADRWRRGGGDAREASAEDPS